MATRIWCTESHSSLRTFGSHSTIFATFAASASTTVRPGVPSGKSAGDGGTGAPSMESPSAVRSLDGLSDSTAPATFSTADTRSSSFAPSALVAMSPRSSTSHSRHFVSPPPGSSDQAVTWSSQNSAMASPCALNSTDT